MEVSSIPSGIRWCIPLLLACIIIMGCDRAALWETESVMARESPSDERWLWVQNAGNDHWTEATDLAVLPGGDVVVGGFGRGKVRFGHSRVTVVAGRGGLVARYRADGALVWARSIGDVGTFSISAVAASPGGIVYVAGNLMPAGGSDRAATAVLGRSELSHDMRWTDGVIDNGDAFIAALEAETGDPLWATQMNADSMSDVHGVIVASDGSLYVTGYFTSSLTPGGPSAEEVSIYLSKYSAGGERLWSRAVGVNKWIGKTSAAEASDGSVYLAGSFAGHAHFGEITATSESQSEFFVARYSPGGDLIWARSGATRGAGPEADPDEVPARGYYRGTSYAYAVAARPGGGVVIGGAFRGKITFADTTITSRPISPTEHMDDAFVAAFDVDGRELWIATGGGPKADPVQGLDVDEEGNVYATGSFMGEAWFGEHRLFAETGEVFSPRLIFVTKYDREGTALWATQSVASGGYSAGNAIAFTGDGHCYAAGVFDGQPRFGRHHTRGARGRSLFVARLDC